MKYFKKIESVKVVEFLLTSQLGLTMVVFATLFALMPLAHADHESCYWQDSRQGHEGAHYHSDGHRYGYDAYEHEYHEAKCLHRFSAYLNESLEDDGWDNSSEKYNRDFFENPQYKFHREDYRLTSYNGKAFGKKYRYKESIIIRFEGRDNTQMKFSAYLSQIHNVLNLHRIDYKKLLEDDDRFIDMLMNVTVNGRDFEKGVFLELMDRHRCESNRVDARRFNETKCAATKVAQLLGRNVDYCGVDDPGERYR